VDGDGDPDIVVANHWSSTISVLLNNGNGTFLGQLSFPVGQGPNSVALGDINGDQAIDIVTANVGTDDLSVLFNTGSGLFAAEVRWAVGDLPHMARIGGSRR
jgi:hypothetical protein